MLSMAELGFLAWNQVYLEHRLSIRFERRVQRTE